MNIISISLLAGHLTFQCFNSEGATAEVANEVESTTSDSELEVQQLEAKLREKRKREESKGLIISFNMLLYYLKRFFKNRVSSETCMKLHRPI